MKCKAYSASADSYTLGERFASLILVAHCKAVVSALRNNIYIWGTNILYQGTF